MTSVMTTALQITAEFHSILTRVLARIHWLPCTTRRF